MVMYNKELRYICRQHAAGQISWPDYRDYRSKLLQQLTYDGEMTLPVGQISRPLDPDTTAPIAGNGMWEPPKS